MTERALTCPFCRSTEIERVAAWGGQLITSQVRCRGCNTYFEVVRGDFDPEPTVAAARTSVRRT